MDTNSYLSTYLGNGHENFTFLNKIDNGEFNFIKNLTHMLSPWSPNTPDEQKINDKLAWDLTNKKFYPSGRGIIDTSIISDKLSNAIEGASRTLSGQSTKNTASIMNALASSCIQQFSNIQERVKIGRFTHRPNKIHELIQEMVELDKTVQSFKEGVQLTQKNKKLSDHKVKVNALGEAGEFLTTTIHKEIEKLAKVILETHVKIYYKSPETKSVVYESELEDGQKFNIRMRYNAVNIDYKDCKLLCNSGKSYLDQLQNINNFTLPSFKSRAEEYFVTTFLKNGSCNEVLKNLRDNTFFENEELEQLSDQLFVLVKTLKKFGFEISPEIKLLANEIFEKRTFNIFLRDALVNINKGNIDRIGYKSKSRPNIFKFKIHSVIAKKFDLPFMEKVYSTPVQYDTNTGEFTIKVGHLGEGQFRIVNKILSVKNSKAEFFALGKQNLNTEDKTLQPIVSKMADNEVAILQKLKGKSHVLQLHSDSKYRSSTKKVDLRTTTTEFCNMGELNNHLNRLTRRQKVNVVRGMIIGLQKVHEMKIIHRDLKPQNIFLKEIPKEGGEADIYPVIGDFGMACEANDPITKRPMGAPRYRAPEIFNGQPATFNSDLWSLGLILFQLFNKDLPADLMSCKNEDQIKERLNNFFLIEPVKKDSIDYVIWGLLRTDPLKRMPLAQALKIVENLKV